MSDIALDPTDSPKRSSRKGLITGVVLLLAAAGGSYVAAGRVFGGSGTAPIGESHAEGEPDAIAEPHRTGTEVAFVPLDPMLVSLAGSDRHLRFAAQLEVPPAYASEVAQLAPRLVDTLQDYLRAVGADQLGQADALLRLRSQMLRRLQMVAGPDRVTDLLIMEFVLN